MKLWEKKLIVLLCFVINLTLLVIVINESRLVTSAYAVGAWGGGDIYRIPVSWCALDGSPAADSPNIPNPWGGVDITTDDVLWRRHERATDNIFINDVGITFRSAINDAVHTSLDFPKINDPVIEMPSWEGNLWLYDDQDVPEMNEINRMIRTCQEAWINMTGGTGTVNGITTINIDRFLNLAHTAIDDGVIGSSLCTDLAPPDGICEVPYDGYVFVIDNYYTAPLATGGQNNDPYDQNLGHEFGHSLGLTHRPTTDDPSALMNWMQVTSVTPGGESYVSNIELSSQEVMTVRDNVNDVPPRIPGVETDPENRVLNSEVIESIQMDNIEESQSLLPYQDISYVRAILDTRNNISYFIQDLFGYIPESAKSRNQSDLQYWTLVDLDNNTNTGGNQSLLNSLGVPSTGFAGADLVFLAEPSASKNLNDASTWRISEESPFVEILSDGVARTELRTAVLELHYAANATRLPSEIENRPVYDSVVALMNNTEDSLELDKPFSVQAIVSSNGTILDTLQEVKDVKRETLTLTNPLFPQCFANEIVQIGNNATIQVSGLLSNEDIHALLGPRVVANGTTNNFGNTTIQFTVPSDASPGLHLLTVGVDDTALTADCEIELMDKE